MKRLILVLKLLFFTSLFGYSQDYIEVSSNEWSFMTDTSAFDGVSRAAFIIGTSNDRYVPTPVLSVNYTDGEQTKVYLAYFPIDICGRSTLLIKFSGDSEIYKLFTAYSYQLKRYTIIFDNTLSSFQFVNKLHSNSAVCVRLISSCNMIDAKFSLNGATAALTKLTYEK